MGIKLLRDTENLRMYEVKDATVITNDFVETLNWPEKIKTLCLCFKDPIENDFEILDRNLSGKYFSRLIYRAQKDDLISPDVPASCAEIREYTFLTTEELQDLYLQTERKYFGEYWRDRLGYPWKEYFEGDYLKIIALNAKEYLPKAKALCLRKNDAPVAFLPINRVKHFGEDIDWVTYIWIDKALHGEERTDAKCRLVEWLRRQTAGNVLAGINPFNYPSNRFFRKIGFHSEYLQITRPGKIL